MGTDDIIKDFYYNNDGSEEDNSFAEWVAIGGPYRTYSLNTGVEFYRGGRGGYYQSILRNTPTSFEMTVILQHSESENSLSNNAKVWVKLTDGNYYCVGIEGQFNVGGEYYAYQKTSVRPSITYDRMEYITTPDIPEEYFCALSLRFKSNGYVDLVKKFYTNTDTNMRLQYPTKADLHVLTGDIIVADIFMWSGAKIEEIGFTNAYADNDYNINTRFFGIYIDANLPTPAGGDATIENVISYMARHKLGAGAESTIIQGYHNDTELATIRSNQGKSVIIYDTIYGKIRGKGEIKRQSIDHDLMIVTNYIGSIGRKLLNTPTGLDAPNGMVIGSVTGINIWNHRMSTLYPGIAAGDILTFKDSNKFDMKIHPVTGVYELYDNELGQKTWKTGTADVEADSYEPCYYLDVSATYPRGRAWGIWTEHTVVDENWNAIRMLFTLDHAHKNDVVFDKVVISFAARFSRLQGAKVDGTAAEKYPAILLWNYSLGTPAWDVIYQYDKDLVDDRDMTDSESFVNATIQAAYEADDDSGMSPVINLTLDLLSHLEITFAEFKTKYMDPLGVGYDTDNFKTYRTKIGIQGAHVATTGMNPVLETHYVSMELKDSRKSEFQTPDFDLGKITSINDGYIVVDDFGESNGFYPQSEGFNDGDEVIWTKPIETQLINAFATTSFTLVTDFDNNYESDTDPSDVSNVMLAFWLNTLGSKHNWIWVERPTSIDDITFLTDKLTPTGITLTDTDKISDEEYKLDEDTYDIMDEIRIYGGDNLFKILKDGVDYNIEVANSLGAQTVIYNDPNLVSASAINAYAISKIQLHTKKNITYIFPINLSNAKQNLSALEVGDSVIVNTSEFAAPTVLMIHESYYVNIMNGPETLRLVLRRRNV